MKNSVFNDSKTLKILVFLLLDVTLSNQNLEPLQKSPFAPFKPLKRVHKVTYHANDALDHAHDAPNHAHDALTISPLCTHCLISCTQYLFLWSHHVHDATQFSHDFSSSLLIFACKIYTFSSMFLYSSLDQILVIPSPISS